MKRIKSFPFFHHVGETSKRNEVLVGHVIWTHKLFHGTLSLSQFLEIRQKDFVTKASGQIRQHSLVSCPEEVNIKHNVKIGFEIHLRHIWYNLLVSSFWDSSVWRNFHPETSGSISSGKEQLCVIFHLNHAYSL